MSGLQTIDSTQQTNEAILTIPLSALRCISRASDRGKIVCEISTAGMVRLNDPSTLDEIINDSRLDYAQGNYSVYSTAKDLLADLHS